MPWIFHLTTPAAWDEAALTGEYRPASLASEGFIHASTEQQLVATANRHFAHLSSVLLLKIDCDHLRPRIVWEKSPHSETPFPHLYGPLNVDAVVATSPWKRDDQDRFSDPAIPV